MSWQSVREYTRFHNLSTSTVRRHIQQGRLEARKFGRNWYIRYPEGGDGAVRAVEETPEVEESFLTQELAGSGDLQSVVAFSSKALHHYLLMSDKLVAEKDLRLKEKEAELIEKKQEAAELEAYVKILEGEIARLKERPEGWQ